MQKIASCESLQKYDDGLLYVNEAIKIDSTNSQLYVIKGKFLSYLLKDHDAIIEFKTALALNSQNTSANYNLGFTYGLIEKYDSAIHYYNNALKSKSINGFKFERKQNSNLPEIYQQDIREEEILFQRGKIYYDQNSQDLAKNDFEYCYRLKYQLPITQLYLGIIYVVKGDATGCKLLKESLANNEERAKLYLNKYCK